MQIDVLTYQTWADFNYQLKCQLGALPEKIGVRSYKGVAHAMVESFIGVAKLFPLKKKIYYFKNMNSLIEPALMNLAKEGYQIQALDFNILKEPEVWIAGLTKEDLMVIYAVDDPLLGRLYPIEQFEQKLLESHIIKIKVSHNAHRFNVKENWPNFLPDRNSLWIYSHNTNFAFTVSGERCRVGAIVADSLSYFEPIHLDWVHNRQQPDSGKIIEFEKKCIAGAQPVLKLDEPRIFDRAIIYWLDMDGEAVVQRLAKALRLKLQQPGEETNLETASPSRWGGLKTMSFLKEFGLSDEMIRGLVMIDQELIDKAGEFEKTLLDVRQSILKDQLGA